MTKQKWDYIAKIVMIGDSACGKSSLTIRLTDDRFSSLHDVTIAAEIGSKIVEVGGGVGGAGAPESTSDPCSSTNTGASIKKSKNSSSNSKLAASSQGPQYMKLQIWDTAGQEHFRAVTRSYFRNAAGCLLVYDVTRRDTFIDVKSWLEDIRSQADEDISICLVGNKNDLSPRQVTYDEAAIWAADNKLLSFVETSAKTGDNVVEAYLKVANDIHAKIVRGKFDLADRTKGVKANTSTPGFLNLSIDANAEANKNNKNQNKCC